jgi:hypothetical protein
MPERRRGLQRRKNQPPSAFTIAVMVGAVGFSLAGSSRGGLSGGVGFFLAFALTFLVLWGGRLFAVGQRRMPSSADTDASGPETQATPSGVLPSPNKKGGNVQRRRSPGLKKSAPSRNMNGSTDESS